jgi:hypothetical protein
VIRQVSSFVLVSALVVSAAACGTADVEDPDGGVPGETATPEPTDDPGNPGGDPYKPQTVQQAWQRFGDCMDLAEFESTGMPEVAWQSAESGAGGGRCFSCHETGTGGALLSIEPDIFFEENRKTPFVMKLVSGTVDESGSFADLVPSWRFRDKGEDPNHPEYILTDERTLSLESFVNLTLERFHKYDQPCGTGATP